MTDLLTAITVIIMGALMFFAIYLLMALFEWLSLWWYEWRYYR